jgi:hypothetical protein
MGDATGEGIAFEQPGSQAPLDHSRHHQEPDDDDYLRYEEDEADTDDRVAICSCGRSTIGEGCKACGDPLCSMGSSAKGGFCLNPCPTAADQLPENDHVHSKECLLREVKLVREVPL